MLSLLSEEKERFWGRGGHWRRGLSPHERGAPHWQNGWHCGVEGGRRGGGGGVRAQSPCGRMHRGCQDSPHNPYWGKFIPMAAVWLPLLGRISMVTPTPLPLYSETKRNRSVSAAITWKKMTFSAWTYPRNNIINQTLTHADTHTQAYIFTSSSCLLVPTRAVDSEDINSYQSNVVY